MTRLLAYTAMCLLAGCSALGRGGPSTVAASDQSYPCARRVVQGLGYLIVEESDALGGARWFVAERTTGPDQVGELSVWLRETPEGKRLQVHGARYRGGRARAVGTPTSAPPLPPGVPRPGVAGVPDRTTTVRVGRRSSRGRISMSPGPAAQDAAAVRAECGRPGEASPIAS